MNQRDILDLLTRVHSAGQPDEDLNAVIPGDLWRELTDMQAKLLYEKHNPPEYVPSGWNDAITAAAKVLRDNAHQCEPGSPAEQQNWPFLLETMARSVEKLKIPTISNSISQEQP